MTWFDSKVFWQIFLEWMVWSGVINAGYIVYSMWRGWIR